MSRKQDHTKLYINEKVAGEVVGDVLRIIKKSPSHFCTKYQGYGISPETLLEAERLGARYLNLTGYDGEEFRLSIRQYIAAATLDSLGTFGKQFFLSVRWLRWYSGHTPGYRNEPQPAQSSLFGSGQR